MSKAAVFYFEGFQCQTVPIACWRTSRFDTMKDRACSFKDFRQETKQDAHYHNKGVSMPQGRHTVINLVVWKTSLMMPEINSFQAAWKEAVRGLAFVGRVGQRCASRIGAPYTNLHPTSDWLEVNIQFASAPATNLIPIDTTGTLKDTANLSHLVICTVQLKWCLGLYPPT